MPLAVRSPHGYHQWLPPMATTANVTKMWTVMFTCTADAARLRQQLTRDFDIGTKHGVGMCVVVCSAQCVCHV
jgi:hypothetical protein